MKPSERRGPPEIGTITNMDASGQFRGATTTGGCTGLATGFGTRMRPSERSGLGIRYCPLGWCRALGGYRVCRYAGGV